MFVARIENTRNAILTLTQNESEFQLYNIEGLNPPSAQINVAKVASMDGSKFNSSKLLERNLVIYIKLRGNVEENRIRLYKFFNTKEWCKFYYKNNSRDVYIEGYVENVDITPFTNNEIMQVSILCANPFFKAIDEIVDDLSKVTKMFKFPFSINVNEPIPFSIIDEEKITNVINNSETKTGVIIDINVLGSVSALKIVCVSTGDIFEIKYPLIENDRVVINTNKGEKTIKLYRDGVETNIFTSIVKGSKFFELDIGENYFSYLADDGACDELIHIEFKHCTMYRGV